jgi:hypothetical protein
MVSTAQKNSTHYDYEDIPDESLETALDMRDSAALSMEQLHERSVRLVEHTGTVINDASRIVSDIRRWAKKNKNGELVSATVFIRTSLDTALEAIKQAYQVVEAARQVETNDKAVIDTQFRQIEELAGELEIFNNAIEFGDTGNSRFEPLMRIAREEIQENAESQGYENFELELYADIQHYIRHLTGIEDYNVTSRLISLIAGSAASEEVRKAKPTKAEITAFKNLLEAIQARITPEGDEDE